MKAAAKTENLNDQIKQVADLQAKSLEPMRLFGALAADAMEQVMRKNYAVMGDFIDFTVKQANLPLKGENVGEMASAQVAETAAFGELLGTRAGEYMELASAYSAKVREAADDAVAAAKAA